MSTPRTPYCGSRRAGSVGASSPLRFKLRTALWVRAIAAAIARTQRAVRNLNRNGEEAPTEPALRDPQ